MIRTNFYEFKKAIDVVVKVPDITKKSELNNITITAGEQIIISKANTKTKLETKIDAEKTENEKIFIPSNIIKLLQKIKSGEKVEIYKDKIRIDKKEIEFEPGHHEINFNKDYEELFSITERELQFLLSCKYACDKNEFRPYLQGIYIDNNNFVALDGYRMAVRQGNFNNLKPFILGKETIELLNKFINNSENIINIEISTDGKYIKFKLHDITIIGENVDATYIDYKGIIPDSVNAKTIITAKDKNIEVILEALKLYDKKMTAVLHIDLPKVIMQSQHSSIKITDQFEFTGKGEPIKIAFNPEYLEDVLKPFTKDKNITLEFYGPTSPLCIRGQNKIELLLPITE